MSCNDDNIYKNAYKKIMNDQKIISKKLFCCNPSGPRGPEGPQGPQGPSGTNNDACCFCVKQMTYVIS